MLNNKNNQNNKPDPDSNTVENKCTIDCIISIISSIIMTLFLLVVIGVTVIITYQFFKVPPENKDYVYLTEDQTHYMLSINSKNESPKKLQKLPTGHKESFMSANTITSDKASSPFQKVNLFYPHMSTDQSLTTILEIVFILVVIVLGGELYTFGMVKKEFDEVRKIKNKLEREHREHLYKLTYQTDTLKRDIIRAQILSLVESEFKKCSAKNTFKKEIKQGLSELVKNFPTDRTVIFTLDCVYDQEHNYYAGINLYSNFIKEKEKRNEYDKDMADAYFNRACTRSKIYPLASVDERKEIQKLIADDLRKAISYNSEMLTDHSSQDSDFKVIKNEEWFTKIWKKVD